MGDPIGRILIRKGYITEEDLAEAITIQKESGGLVGIILINNKKITEDQLSEALSYQDNGEEKGDN